ncbi:MAG: hypothetical protein JXR96_16020 [Deltaproteobacteria bacterium]|nr:hypothetical protein [Deltaproteobacteria bacterium]
MASTAGGFGAADGTGPLLSHVTSTSGATSASAAAPGTASGAALGTTAKTATMSKILALGATGSAILGFALIAAAAVCAGYLGYKLVHLALGEEDAEGSVAAGKRASRQKAKTTAAGAQTVSLDNL